MTQQMPPSLARRFAAVTLCGAAISLTGCFGSKPPKGPAPDPELAESTSSARMAYARGANEQAVNLFLKAVDRAREMDDARELAGAAYNLAAAQIRAGRYEEARTSLREAEGEAQRAGVDTADILLLEAKVAQLREDAPEALTFADRVLTDKGSKATAAHRVQVRVLRGEMAMELGQADLARTELTKAEADLRSAGDTAGPAVRAGVTGLSARISQSAGDNAKAAGLFDQQADLLRQAGVYRDMAKALARAGAAWRDAGRRDEAADRYYRAGRSFLGQNDYAEARRQLQLAAATADPMTAGTLPARIRALQESIPEMLMPPTSKPAAPTTGSEGK
jgi:tetratricopeptide (TPR) repeat protein